MTLNFSSFFRQVALTLFALLLFCGCEIKQKEYLKVGISPWPGYEPLVLAVQKGFYGDIDVHIIRFATPTESFSALRDGTIDVAAFTADEVLHYAEVVNKPKIFLILDVSNGADAIVAKPYIKTVDDLKWKRVGVEPSALGEYMLSRALDFSGGVSVKDIKLKPIDIGSHENAYKAGKVDALVTYDPSKTVLLRHGAHIIFDSSKIPYEVVDVAVANSETIAKRQKALKAFTDGWFRAVDYIKKHQAETMGTMGGYEQMSSDEFKNSFSQLFIPTREQNAAMLDGSDKTFQSALIRLCEQMLQKKTILKSIDTPLLLDSSIVKSGFK